MDQASVIGLIGGMIVLVVSVLIAGASFGAFIDYPSLMVVFGGAFCATLVSFPLRNFLGIGSVTKKVFFNRPENVTELIQTIVELAQVARRDGLLALEAKQEEIKNPFMVLGIQMAVDGTRPEVIEDVLRTELEAVATRHRDGKAVLDQVGRMAPAFGMIGTLMGLIIMLGNLDDPDAIGPSMAVALITTLYGAIVSNMVFIPWADKLGFINRQELIAMEIVIRGIMGIQSGDNPRVIEQKLNTFVPPKYRATGKKESEAA